MTIINIQNGISHMPQALLKERKYWDLGGVVPKSYEYSFVKLYWVDGDYFANSCLFGNFFLAFMFNSNFVLFEAVNILTEDKAVWKQRIELYLPFVDLIAGQYGQMSLTYSII